MVEVVGMGQRKHLALPLPGRVEAEYQPAGMAGMAHGLQRAWSPPCSAVLCVCPASARKPAPTPAPTPPAPSPAQTVAHRCCT